MQEDAEDVSERMELQAVGVPVESCTIITTAANRLLRPLPDRMPAILAPHDCAARLGEDTARDMPKLLALLCLYSPEAMRA